MAEKPLISKTDPIFVAVEAGETYWWCRCGRSQNQPFCDGAHAGTGIEPLPYTAKSDKKLRFCTCKATQKEPFCDNSHIAL